ncbi:Uncharacterized protein ECG_04341 [Echinococcus granulosus]|uniref:PRKR interacting protein 1 n=1 Tax=Echinococcus granulosus TaxID=6210 RepID=U6J287_ECHGR|nr:PRKR-interacting protein [Echinococcus granulosus]EUB64248.1 PRKR-interacting protein [Echinococcus granulosus]KAH9283060.1 Uncharacterized protein ECG_04341 [Echinococcus granulosus]CDS17377.1 PRKR interacting protein 1 [Echinococcus granulosus]
MTDAEDPEESGVPAVNPYKMGTYDLVRMRINKLMERPDVPVVIPESSRRKEPKAPPDFVRNVWGSAAGVGSGDFHIYRGIRRREYARLEFIEQQAKEKAKADAYIAEHEAKNRAIEEKRAKKRAKRQRRKEARKRKRKDGTDPRTTDDDCSDQEIECTESKLAKAKSDSAIDEGEDSKSE